MTRIAMAGKFAIETRKIVYMSGDSLAPREGIANLSELPPEPDLAGRKSRY